MKASGLSLLSVVLLVAGVVLIYSAVKNKDPRDVVLTSLGQKARYTATFGTVSNSLGASDSRSVSV